MKNCLVTELNGIVDNPNLQKFNSMVFHRITGDTNAIAINIGQDTAQLYSDGNLTVGGVSVADGYSFTGQKIINTDGTYIEVIGKYSIIRISTQGFYFNAEDFIINNSGEIIFVAYNKNLIKGDISKFEFDTIHVSQYIPLGTTTKDISAIAKYTIETDISLEIAADNTIEGNVGEAINATEGGIEYVKEIYNYSTNSKLELNLNDLSESTKIVRLLWSGTNVHGNLSALSGCTNILSISLFQVNLDEDVSVFLDELNETKKSGSMTIYLASGNTLDGVAWDTLPKNQYGGVVIDFDSSGWSVRQNP